MDTKIQKSRRPADASRRRATRACDGCRRVKERCEGGIPCRRCVHLKRSCEFTGTAARFPASSSSAHDAGLASSSGADPGGPSSSSVSDVQQRMSSMERLLVHFVGNISMDTETLLQLADSLDDEVAGAQGRRVAGVDDSQGAGVKTESDSSDEVEMDDITVQPLENNVTHYSGEFSHWNFSMRIKNWIEKSGPYRTDAPDAPKIREFYRVEELQSPSDTSQLLSSCPPRYVADFLVRAFFHYAEGNYFYVDRTWLNRKMDLIYDTPASLTRRDVPTLVILFMVLAVGTQYAYLDSDAWKTSGDANTFSEDSVGIMLYREACRLLPDVITIASSESVQACLLIGLYTLPLDPSGLSWVYLNLAMKLAIQNGMHRRYPGQASNPVMIETRNRVWWTLHMIEKRVGTFHGRPTSIASNEVDADSPANRPDIWPGSPPRNTPQLLATLQLSQFLSRIAHEISCFKTHNKQTTLYALARLSKAKEDLQQWWHALPEDVSYANTWHSPSSPIPRAAFHLRLEFCMVRMYAGRLFITHRREHHSSKPSKSPTSNPAASREDTDSPMSGLQQPTSGGGSQHNVLSSHSSSQRRSSLVSDCVDAAISVVDICRTLQAGIGLARASYTEFSHLRIALLVILSQFLAKQQNRHQQGGKTTEALRQPLCDGIAMLKGMSTWGASARFDASLIEAFEHTIARMEGDDVSNSGSHPKQPQRPNESSYEMFKRWESMWQGGDAIPKISPSTRDDGGGQPGDTLSSDLSPAALAPPQLGSMLPPWDGSGGLAPDSAVTGPDTGSSFGIDWSYSTMPMLEGLSAMLEQGYGFNVEMENQQQEGPPRMDY